MKWLCYILIFIVVGVTINLLAGYGDRAAERLVAGLGMLIAYCIGWAIWSVIKKMRNR